MSLRFQIAIPGAVALALLAPPVTATNYGRELVLNETLNASIDPTEDTDDFVFDAGTGWKVSVKAKKAKEADLAPVLTLIAPDGSVVTDGVNAKAAKSSAKLSATLLEGGRFAVRVSGNSGSGAYGLSWKLKQGKAAAVKNAVVGGETTTRYPFPARGGALVSWKLKFKGDGAATVTAVEDPDGGDGGYDPESDVYTQRKYGSETVKDFPLPDNGGGGDWHLVVENKLQPVTMSLSIKMKLPKRDKTSHDLTVLEPVLTGISHAASTCGVAVSVSGENLGAAAGGLYFGSTAASGVDVIDGKTATCSVPGGSGTVDIIYVAEDGQVAVLEDAFTFNPLPTLTGIDPLVGPNVGRIELTLTGTGFETEGAGLYEVLIGGVPASRVQVISSSVITCQIPAHVSGAKDVVLRDACGQTVPAPVQFTYSSLLSISVVIPSAIPAFGGVPVTVYGAGFKADDKVYLDGNLVPATDVTYQGTVLGHTIAGTDVPAHAPGKVDVKVVAASLAESVKNNGLAYYAFSDATSTAIPAATAFEDWGGVSTVAIDRDGDGVVDYLVISHTAALSATRPGTRVLSNNGSGVFTDVTATVMPEATEEEGFGAGQVLSSKFNLDSEPDLYLARPGTGTEARRTGDKKFIDAWARVLLASGSGGFNSEENSGANSKFSVPGQLTYSNCFIYDFDFRSVGAALGDLDGDLDKDLVLVNDASITDFTGVNCTTKWVSCAGGYYTACYSFSSVPFGSALRLCTSGSNGGFNDRTEYMLTATPSVTEDFRAVAASIGDFNADFLNDFAITHNLPIDGGSTSATRIFQQKVVLTQTSFQKTNGFMPNPAGGDDWRGDAVSLTDLNGDLYRDLVISLDSDIGNGGPTSTRILIQNTATGKLEDKTSTVLAGLFPAGDKGHAKVILSVDIDKDGDADLILSTPGSAGASNPQTRLFINVGNDPATGLPVFVNGASILPAVGTDAGNAVSVLAADIDDDGDLDIILTDTHAGNAVKRTRIWKQDR